MELTILIPTSGSLPQVTSPPLWTNPPLLRKARRGPPHKPFTSQRCSRIPHQTHTGQHPSVGSPRMAHTHCQASGGSPPPQPLSSVSSATQRLQGYWIAVQDRVPPPPPKPGSLSPAHPAASRLPTPPPPQDLRVSSQALPAALQASPSPLAVGCALPHPSYPASYSGPRQETTHPSPAAQPRGPRP